tara:strand:- start:12894 stop:13394 length:501 start_codon:yes stop_codon:yes gene_type:complete
MEVINCINKEYVEIECRLSAVNINQFDIMLKKLKNSKYISCTDVEDSVDYIYNNGIRRTVTQFGSTIIQKTILNVKTFNDYKLVASIEYPLTSVLGNIVLTRKKKRYKFTHNYWLYTLTEVHQIKDDTSIKLYEVEIEIQNIIEARSKSKKHLLESFQLKVNQLVR